MEKKYALCTLLTVNLTHQWPDFWVVKRNSSQRTLQYTSAQAPKQTRRHSWKAQKLYCGFEFSVLAWLYIHADRHQNVPISIAQSKLIPTTIKGEKRTKTGYYASVAILHNAPVFAGFNCCKQRLHGCKPPPDGYIGGSLATISYRWQ